VATAGLQSNPVKFRFSVFEVDLVRGELFKSGTRIKLQKQPFEILCALLERAGEIVSRQELRERLWPGNTFVEYEDSLNTAVRKLRAVLSDSSATPLYIETLARQGYRFVAPVQVVLKPAATDPAAPQQRLILVPQPKARRSRVGQKFVACVLVTLTVVAAGIWILQRRQTPSAALQEAQARKAQAVDLYQKGRLLWNKRTPAAFAEGLRYFQQAVAADPQYARAYAGIADSYALMSGYDLVPQDEYMPKARAAALKAIELDNKLAEPHASLAVIAQNYDWDWQTAEEEYRRAIALDPNYATAHHWYAECLALQGRFPEALAEIDRARQLDPVSLIIAADRGAILYFARQYHPAIEQFRAVLALEPYFPRAFMIGWAYIADHQYEASRRELQKWQNIADEPWFWAMSVHIAVRTGDSARARAELTKLEQWHRKHTNEPLPLVDAYLALGEREKALRCLDVAAQRHAPSINALKVDPVFDPLRREPHYHELLKRLRLE